MLKTITLSAGHTPNGETGASANGLHEEIINIQITKKVAELLRRHSIPILEVPDDLTLVQTIAWINARASQIDLCLEIHLNAGGGTGVEAWYYQNLVTKADDIESKNLATIVCETVAEETGWRNRGAKGESTNQHGKLGFVHDTKPLAALIECGFIDNVSDIELYKTEEGVMKIATGIAKGLLAYIGEEWIPIPTHPPEDLNLQKKIDELNEKIASLSGLVNQVKDRQDKLSDAVDNVKKDTEEIYKDRDEIVVIKEKLTVIDGKVENSSAKQTTIETNLKQEIRSLKEESEEDTNIIFRRIKILEEKPTVLGEDVKIVTFGKWLIGKFTKQEGEK